MKRILFELLCAVQVIALLTALPGTLLSRLIDRLRGKHVPTPIKWRWPS